MLYKGMAVVCRTQEEYAALCKVANREGYSFQGREQFEDVSYIPIRISFNNYAGKNCCTYARNMYHPLNQGITEVYEASEFLHNIIISERIKRKE